MEITRLRQELKQLLIDELDLKDFNVAEIDDQVALFGEGLGLDSLDALQLAMAVEERYGIEVPEDERAKEVFASVAALADYIERARSGA
jgi:acyl carrier protein